MEKKLKVVNFTNPVTNVNHSITFLPAHIDSSDGRFICDIVCSYRHACSKLCHPKDPMNTELCFTDFCGELGESDQDMATMYPEPGSLESLFRGESYDDVFKQVINADTLVSLSDVVDRVCLGWCDMYVSDHSNCTSDNAMCIMHKLLKNYNSKTTEDSNE